MNQFNKIKNTNRLLQRTQSKKIKDKTAHMRKADLTLNLSEQGYGIIRIFLYNNRSVTSGKREAGRPSSLLQ